MITVPNLNILNSLVHKEENEVAYVENENKYYQYIENKWVEKESDRTGSVDLYTVNKQIVAQLPNFTFDQRMSARELIHDVTFDPTKKYYMLLCKDLSYYTLFVRDETQKETIGAALFDCLDHVGVIKSIELTDSKDALEIWLMCDNEAYVFYFFNYDAGVVLCR
jgi:hypothetical protein